MSIPDDHMVEAFTADGREVNDRGIEAGVIPLPKDAKAGWHPRFTSH